MNLASVAAGDQATILGLDLGATQIRAAAVTAGGGVLDRQSSTTPIGDGPDAVVEACIAVLAMVLELRSAVGPRPIAVGISAPGPVDPMAGVLIDPPNMGPTFRDVQLAARVADALGLPCVLDRDTQVTARAEAAHGAARGCRDFIYLTVSSGIGGAIVSDGRLLYGPDGAAGELGHVLVDRNGPMCGCGVRGHLEAIASGVAIARAAREAATGGTSPALTAVLELTGDRFGAEHVAAAANAGDEVAGRILEDARDAFALAVVSMVDVFNPERIVVGGSVARGEGDRLLSPARIAVGRLAFRLQARRVEIVEAALGDDGGLIGCWDLAAGRLSLGATVSSIAGPSPRAAASANAAASASGITSPSAGVNPPRDPSPTAS